MMILAFLAAALAAPDNLEKVERCRAAVHGALETAVAVCRPSSAPVDVLAPGGLSSSCSAALAAGASAGRSGPSLPPAMRAGLVRNFDKALARCLAPPVPAVPVRDDVVNLWD